MSTLPQPHRGYSPTPGENHAPIKILYLSQSRLPSTSANSIHVIKMCSAFSQLGHEVYLIGYKGKTKDQSISSYYGTSINFEIKAFDIKEEPGETLKLGIACLSWKLLNRGLSFDILYSRSSISLFFLLFGKTPFIFESHSTPRTWLHKFCEIRILRNKKLNQLVCISQQLKNHYLRTFPWLEDSKVLVAADAADNFVSEPTAAALKGHAPIKVGYIGHLYPGKGGEIIIPLAERLPDIDFHIVGGLGKDIDRLRQTTKAPNLFFYGHVSHAETHRYLQAFDIVLAPYLKNVRLARTSADIGKWMSPLKIFEYMAARKPIVASNLRVLTEVLQHEHNCLLAAPDNLNEWVSHIERLACNEADRDRIATQAHSDFEEMYTWKKRAQNIIHAAYQPT